MTRRKFYIEFSLILDATVQSLYAMGTWHRQLYTPFCLFQFFLSHPNHPGRLWSPPRFLFNGHRGIFRGSNGRSANFTTNLHLMRRFKRSGAVCVLIQNVCMAKTGATSHLTHFSLHHQSVFFLSKDGTNFTPVCTTGEKCSRDRKALRLQCVRAAVSKELPFAYRPQEWRSPGRISPAAFNLVMHEAPWRRRQGPALVDTARLRSFVLNYFPWRQCKGSSGT